MMPTVSDICTKELVSIEISASIWDAVKLMEDKNIRSILVIGTNPNEYSILTSNDAIECKIKNISLDTPLSKITLQDVHTVDANVNILEIINQDKIIYKYLIVMSEDKVIGILSQTDIINNIDPQILFQKQTISNIILQYSVQTIYENEPTINAINIMKSKDLDSIVIIDKKNKHKGIFTTKDFLTVFSNQLDLNLPIKLYMNSPLQTVSSDIKIFEALEYIKIKHFKRIVVTNDDDEITGVITQSELLRLINNKWIELIKDRGTELSKMNEKLEKNASTDFLTQLYNRRKFDTLILYEIEQIKRYKHGDLSIILLDIDNFKEVNDVHGHDIGDSILKDLANILQISSRKSDICCRWGGEEFSLSLSHTDIEKALLVAQKIRILIENYNFEKNLKITCSFGVAQYRITDTYKSLFKRVDTALYQAKNTGKNKVTREQFS